MRRIIQRREIRLVAHVRQHHLGSLAKHARRPLFAFVQTIECPYRTAAHRGVSRVATLIGAAMSAVSVGIAPLTLLPVAGDFASLAVIVPKDISSPCELSSSMLMRRLRAS